MFSNVRGKGQVARSFWQRFIAADPGLLAAAIAFNAFFALVPSAFAFLTAASLLGRDEAAFIRTEQILRGVVPPSVVDFVLVLLSDVAEVVAGQRGTIFVVSLLAALYSGSRGVVALQRGLARIEGLPEHRRRWRRRAVAMGLTMAGAIAFLLTALLLITSGRLIDVAVELTGWEALRVIRVWVGFPAATAGLYLFLYSVYRWGPTQPLPGARWSAIVSAVTIILTSIGIGIALQNIDLATTFGVLGTVAVALAWMYVITAALLLSAALVGYGFLRRNGESQSASASISGNQE